MASLDQPKEPKDVIQESLKQLEETRATYDADKYPETHGLATRAAESIEALATKAQRGTATPQDIAKAAADYNTDRQQYSQSNPNVLPGTPQQPKAIEELALNGSKDPVGDVGAHITEPVSNALAGLSEIISKGQKPSMTVTPAPHIDLKTSSPASEASLGQSFQRN